MGLDITAYRQLKPVECGDEGGCLEDHAHVYGNGDNFPGRDEGVTPGCYMFVGEHAFRAGAYSGYNRWREQLAELAGYTPEEAWSDAAKGKPFYELVNFSDFEGTIGPVVAMRLAADFAAFQEKADAHEDEYFREKYAEWRKAFEMASDNGAVCLH